MNSNRCWLSEIRKWEARGASGVVKMLRKGAPRENRWLKAALSPDVTRIPRVLVTNRDATTEEGLLYYTYPADGFQCTKGHHCIMFQVPPERQRMIPGVYGLQKETVQFRDVPPQYVEILE